ncbi:MAG: ABC transporter permease [Bacteroidetes bacterium]|nr:ABC transporter permease [Bacteroidota bacterium]
MSVMRFLLEKEFRQIFRNKSILPLIMVLPIIQLLIIPLAAEYEIKNINIAIVDHDHSTYSQELISNITSSGYFKLTDYSNSYPDAFQHFETDRSDLILEIPIDFERNLIRESEHSLYLAVNAINGTKASVGSAYLGRIINDFNRDIQLEWADPSLLATIPKIEITSSNWFNPMLNYQFFMVPGILAILVTMVGVYMCSLNIVKEKELGTIEQINVTPIKKYHFLLGKLIPFWIIGNFMFSIGLLGVARIVYHIVPVGSLLLLYGYLAIFLVALLGIGLLISTYSGNQQQSMSLAFFTIMIFILMGGLFTPIESMPEWAKWIARFNPVAYFIQVIRMIVMKGSCFQDIKQQILIMLGFAFLFNTWAILNYRKTN